MPHIGKDELVRAGEAGRSEIARMAAHLAICPACRALASGVLAERAATAKRAPLLKCLAQIAAFEKARATDRLLAKAEMVGLRRLTRGAQKERVIASRLCHSPVFLEELLDALRSPRPREEAESFTNLAVFAVQGIDPAEGSDAFKNDSLAMIWIETANARRIRGEWQHAESALLRADEYETLGTGDPSIRARGLSIAGSLQCDQGRRNEAMVSLEECRKAYAGRDEWPLVGRTLVQMAHCIADDEPERALGFLDRARSYIPLGDTSLRCHAEQIRTDCLVTVGRMEDALRAFAESERVRPFHHRASLALRSVFFSARLLEGLGYAEEAETLFDAVVSEELERGHFKDAVLDLVYVFGFHLRHGSPDRAAALGVRALAELDRRDIPAANEECRSVLTSLIDAARAESLEEGMLRSARAYLRVEWNRPRLAAPKPATSEKRASPPPRRTAVTVDPMFVEPLLARARWSRLRRETRPEQCAQVAQSPQYHTAAFVDLLLSAIHEAPTRDEAEFTASLAFEAITPMEAPPDRKHDLQAELWTEVANARRVASEWSKASTALAQAGKHLAQGSGDPLLNARMRSVSASLSADQGRRADALAALDECVALYESRSAWPLVARTRVQLAHTLMDIEPARALALAEQALPLIPFEDSTLRCHAENIRTDCMIHLGEIELALQTFDAAAPFRSGASPIARRRSDFFAARLLECLGHPKEAVQLFEAVIADAFDREAYREAFLDLLYVVGVHIQQGATEEAVALCRLAIERLDLLGLGHEQLRSVWIELQDAITRRAVSLESLAEVREFLKVHWKYPASKPPRFSF